MLDPRGGRRFFPPSFADPAGGSNDFRCFADPAGGPFARSKDPQQTQMGPCQKYGLLAALAPNPSGAFKRRGIWTRHITNSAR